MQRSTLSYLIVPFACAVLSACGGGDERIGKHVELPDSGPTPVAQTAVLGDMTIGDAEIYADIPYNNIFTTPDSTTTLTNTQKLHTEMRRHNGLGPLVWTSPISLGTKVVSAPEIVLRMGAERMDYRLLNPTAYASLQHILWEYTDGSAQMGMSTAGYETPNWRTAFAGKTGTVAYVGEAYQVVIDDSGNSTAAPHTDLHQIYTSNVSAVYDYATNTMTVSLGAAPRLLDAGRSTLNVDPKQFGIEAKLLMQPDDNNYGKQEHVPEFHSAEGMFFGPDGKEFGGVIHKTVLDTNGLRRTLMTSFALRQSK